MPTCKRCHRQTVTITGNPIAGAVIDCPSCDKEIDLTSYVMFVFDVAKYDDEDEYTPIKQEVTE